MQDLVEYIVRTIVNNPSDAVVLENIDENDNTILSIELNEEDKPIVIGRGGKNIMAIRELVKVLARKENKKVFINISE